MKRYFWSLLATCAFTATLAVAEESDTPKSPDTPKKEKVTKMDGTSFFGIVTLTDDYTLKISNDSGIMKIPIALLGEKDFNKFLGGKDRSNDGKLWSERQDALEKQKEENSKTENDPKSKNSKAEDNSAIEIQLGQIAVLQPVISIYESTLADKVKLGQSSSPDSKQGENPGKSGAADDSSPVRLFSGPGTGTLPGSSVAEPVMSIGSSVLQSAGSGVPGAPVGVPGVP